MVRDRIAREFRLSFTVDLDQHYEVTMGEPTIETEVVDASADHANGGEDQ